MPELDNNSIALAGEFAVLSQLSLKGFDANMTLGRTKAVDILVSDPISNKMYRIEVKTHQRQTPVNSRLFGPTRDWMMSAKHEAYIDPKLFYVFVNIIEDKNFEFFVVPSHIVAEYVYAQHKYWLSTRTHIMAEDLLTRRFRIGIEPTANYPIKTPLAIDFQDKWNFTV